MSENEYEILSQRFNEEQAAKINELQSSHVNPLSFDIAPGATSTEVSAEWFDSTALKEGPQKLFRLDRGGELEEHRYYYKFDDSGEPHFYPSITTLLSQVMPSGKPLETWRGSMSYLQGIIDFVFCKMFRQPGIMAQLYTQERANYGSFMHAEFAELLINKSYSLDQLRNRLELYSTTNLLPPMFMNYVGSLQKNLLSMAQFIIDYDVKPIAIEIALLNEPDENSNLSGYGTTLDLVAEMRLKGSADRDYCITDFKSGKGFNEKNELQLFAQRDTWNKHFPELQIERVFNWRPKNWKKFPTYEMTEQTYSKSAPKLYFILGQALIEDSKLDNNLTVCSGIIDLSKYDIKDNFKTYTLAELVKNKSIEKEPEGTAGINENDIKDGQIEIEKTVISKRRANKATQNSAVESNTKNCTSAPEEKEKPLNGLKTGFLNSEIDF